jgi:pyruvate/2-oxoglutarate dehydrogenase complex dihydrolipoamide dehydrogenase (E3) component/uncharacterized membrane protein YdjX (TVP38/TMEM64 family)
MTKRLILVALILAAIAAWFWFDLGSILSLENFQASQGRIAEIRAANPLLFIGGFFLIYVTATALSLPGAAILTLIAGALFGLVTGTILVSFASSIGATLAFLSSRFLLRDWVQAKFGQRLKAIDDGLAKDGAFYLFTLRLVPLFPFFVINLVMGLTRIRTATYYWVSQLGMLAGTIVYVNAGTQLASLAPGKSLLSPSLLGSFVALALLPWFGRWVISFLKRRRIYKGWTRPKRFDRNLIVIGAGSAGLVSSYIAALAKTKVSLIEAHEMGGDCLNTGCVPSKALLKSARVAHAARGGARYGVKASDVTVDFPAVMKRLKQVITDIEPHDSVERFSGLGVDCIKGYARFIDPWTVQVARADGEAQRLTAQAFVIATGAAPVIPPLPGIEDSGYLTSETLWDAMARRKAVPARLTILGGGPIGCELAQAFQRLGSQVTLVEMAERLMLKEDAEAAAQVEAALHNEGVDIRTGQCAVRFAGKGKLIVAGLNIESTIDYDDVLIAVGRRSRLTGFGLEELGLVENGKLAVDDFLASPMSHILLAGDVAGNQQLTHGASHEAWYATVNAIASPFRRYRADYRVLPRVTYTDPEVASVGLTEAEATEKGVPYEVTRYHLDDLDRAIAEGEAHGFVKILTEPGRDRILGATIVATHAGEMIAELVLAMRHNMRLSKIMQTIHSYPTWAEANKYTAGQYGLSRQPVRLQRIAEWWFRWRRG